MEHQASRHLVKSMFQYLLRTPYILGSILPLIDLNELTTFNHFPRQKGFKSKFRSLRNKNLQQWISNQSSFKQDSPSTLGWLPGCENQLKHPLRYPQYLSLSSRFLVITMTGYTAEYRRGNVNSANPTWTSSLDVWGVGDKKQSNLYLPCLYLTYPSLSFSPNR